MVVWPPSTWTKLDGYSYEQALSHYVQVYIPTVVYVENDVVYMKNTLSTNSYSYVVVVCT